MVITSSTPTTTPTTTTTAAASANDVTHTLSSSPQVHYITESPSLSPTLTPTATIPQTKNESSSPPHDRRSAASSLPSAPTAIATNSDTNESSSSPQDGTFQTASSPTPTTAAGNESSLPLQHSHILWIPNQPDRNPLDTLELAFEPNNNNKTLEWKNLTDGCPITAQVSLDTTTWILHTHDIHGAKKSVGGDEFYIYYQQSRRAIMAVSNTSDLGNGSYALNFTTHPFLKRRPRVGRGIGMLVVWLEYSCGIGYIPRPLRDSWSTNGAVLTNWVTMGVPLPPYRLFEKPGGGLIDLGRHRSILAVGDSVMQQFVSLKSNTFFYKNCVFGRNVGDPLSSRNTHRVIRLMNRRLRGFFDIHNNSAVILGAAAWELQKPYGNLGEPLPGQPYTEQEILDDHLDALGVIVSSLRETFPRLTIYWKTGVAMHLHVLKRDKGNDWMQVSRVEYMSQSRTERLYQVQNQLMRELNVTILDIYPASYLLADGHRFAGDAIHYHLDVNKLMMSWFYPYGFNESMYEER